MAKKRTIVAALIISACVVVPGLVLLNLSTPRSENAAGADAPVAAISSQTRRAAEAQIPEDGTVAPSTIVRDEEDHQHAGTAPAASNQTPPTAPVVSPFGVNPVAQAALADDLEDEELAFPALDQVREEVRQNPHHTAPTLVSFARSLAPKMEAAQHSPEKARSLFEELRNCALGYAKAGEQSLASVQALCLHNAKRLSETHPGLAQGYRSLTQKASPEVMDLLAMMGEISR